MRKPYSFISRLPQLALASATALLPLLAAAQDQDGPPGDTSSWGLGIAAMSTQKPYTRSSRENRVLPLLTYENRWLRFAGLGAEIKLPRLGVSEKQTVDFALVARLDGSGYSADDAPILNGMEDRKRGFWVGGKAAWRNDVANLSAEWVADVSGHSKGQRFSLGLARNFRLGQQVMLTPHLGATWFDSKYVDYYFGVRSQEVTASRAAYSGKAGINTELGLRSAFLFDRQNSIFLDVGVTSLAKQIKDSPLVDRSTENRVFMGYQHRF